MYMSKFAVLVNGVIGYCTNFICLEAMTVCAIPHYELAYAQTDQIRADEESALTD